MLQETFYFTWLCSRKYAFVAVRHPSGTAEVVPCAKKRERRDKLTLLSLWCSYSTHSASISNIVHTVPHHTLFH